MKKQGKAIILGVTALALTTIAGSVMDSNQVSAKEKNTSSGYEQLFSGLKPGCKNAKETVGKYEFFYNGKKVSVKKKGEKSYTKTKISVSHLFTNGKVAYYTKNMKLYKFQLKTKKIKKVASYANKKDKNDLDITYISNIRGNNIYLNKSSWEMAKREVFVYNMKTNKTKKVYDGDIIAVNGKYAMVDKDFSTEISADTMDIIKFTKKGAKKVKTITESGMYIDKVDGKFYFIEYDNDQLISGTVYRCNANGKNKEELCKHKNSDNTTLVDPVKVTKNYCIFTSSEDGKYVKVDYKTGNKTVISENEFANL